VPNIRVVVWLCLGKTDIFHDFVLAFARDLVSGKHDLYLTPIRVLTDLFIHKVAQLLGKFGHEKGTWQYESLVSVYVATPSMGKGEEGGSHTGGNAVTVKRLFIRQLLSLSLCLFPHFASFFCGAETTTPLLVHLCTRSYAIDGHEKQFLWLDLPKEMVDVGKYGRVYLFLGHTEVCVFVVGMRAFVATRGYSGFRYAIDSHV